MVTGASTADLAIVLVDARKGVLEQSRRHAFIAALLGIPHIVVAVNKMDLVGFDEGSVRGDPDRVQRVGGQAAHPGPALHPHLGAPRRQRGHRGRCRCPGTRGRRCCTTSRTCTSAPTATSSTPGSRSSGSSGPSRTSTTTSGAMPARSRVACSAIGDEVVVLPSGAPLDHHPHQHPRWRAGDGGAARCRWSSSSRTRSTSRAASCSRDPTTSPPWPPSSRRRSAGWRTRRSGRVGATS